MIKLEIRNQDGSVYWTEPFNDQDACDQWLKEEQTRPYWKPTFTTNIINNSEEERLKQEAAQKAAQERAAAQAAALESIRQGRARRNRSLAEVNDLLDQLINYLGL